LTLPSSSKSSVVQADQPAEKQSSAKLTENLPDGSITYKANAKQYHANDYYEATIQLTNANNNVVVAGAEIVIQLPKAGLDLSTLNLSNSTLREFYQPSLDQRAGKLTLKLKKDIKGKAQLTVKFRAKICGDGGKNYTVALKAMAQSKKATKVIDQNPTFKVEADEDAPVLNAKDKTFYVGELTDANIKAELLKDVTAKDTDDGDLSKQINVDYSQVKPETIGDYQVTYSVTDTTKRTTNQSVMVHIVKREEGGDITVKYVDQDGKQIAQSKRLEGNIGEKYETKAVEVNGYELTQTPANATGTFTATAQTVTYEYEGQLIFESAPTSINFGNHNVSSSTENYSINNISGELAVRDYRSIGSNWRMSVQLVKDFTEASSGAMLGSTLSGFDESGQQQSIKVGESATIYSKQTENHNTVKISSGWKNAGQGLKLSVPAGHGLAESYQATIQWNLQNGVPNE
jgi:hypothetical protein